MAIAPVPRTPQEEEAALAAGIAAGDEEALQELHRRYAPLVFHLACKSLDRPAAEEITQDVFVAVWRRGASYDPGRGTVRTWLLGIAHNRILDELRSRSRRPGSEGTVDDLELAAQDPLPDEALWRDYQRRAIAQALAALPEAQARALRLAYFSELSHGMVADALHVPLGTAKTRIRSGLRGLYLRLGALVAALLVVLGVPAVIVGQRQRARDARALDVLANSHLRILKLIPPGLASQPETAQHAAFRGVPGRETAVLTLTRFPAPPAGKHYVLWFGPRPVVLPDPDREGKAIAILEGSWLAAPWPAELSITAEAGRPLVPTGPVAVSAAPPSP
ncbi:RNA polymerase sigma factor [Geothrix sp. 21YS21S-2]|uniref:RNA polymerase sigma factor n=1 Tax=Geothrix sp. 21YS21S-2 TaxID=3068893 RepID=UPI0027B8D8EF|nr:sigma-70 family RNA polymerase sigma factor [Geothrix sp. 21YS21S-2]